ncbi:MAG: hypothetical protein ACPGSG_02055 [Prolixibacteraceae bacterium]|jgi:hypothetical protein|nr:hypothetical protein [Prolixibacteraceae bacterium]
MVPPKINELLQKYYDGSATTNEMDELIYYFHHTDPLPVELMADSILFKGMHQWRETLPKGDVEVINTDRKKRRLKLHFWQKCSIAASLLLLIFVAEKGYREYFPNQKVVYGYYNGVPITDPIIAKTKMKNSFKMMAPSLYRMEEEVNKLEKINRCQVVLNSIKP